jgi:uncharacterized protein (DUF4415 family)
MGKIVRKLSTAAPLSAEERKHLLRLPADDTKIDYSDIPATTEDDWKNGIRGRFYRPVKQQVTLRIDAPTLDWFRQQTPKGYQTDINRVLGEYVERQRKKAV